MTDRGGETESSDTFCGRRGPEFAPSIMRARAGNFPITRDLRAITCRFSPGPGAPVPVPVPVQLFPPPRRPASVVVSKLLADTITMINDEWRGGGALAPLYPTLYTSPLPRRHYFSYTVLIIQYSSENPVCIDKRPRHYNENGARISNLPQFNRIFRKSNVLNPRPPLLTGWPIIFSSLRHVWKYLH